MNLEPEFLSASGARLSLVDDSTLRASRFSVAWNVWRWQSSCTSVDTVTVDASTVVVVTPPVAITTHAFSSTVCVNFGGLLNTDISRPVFGVFPGNEAGLSSGDERPDPGAPGTERTVVDALGTVDEPAGSVGGTVPVVVVGALPGVVVTSVVPVVGGDVTSVDAESNGWS